MTYRVQIIDGSPTLVANGRRPGRPSVVDYVGNGRGYRAAATYDAARTGTDLDGHWAHADDRDADSANSVSVRRRLRTRSRYETGSNGYYAGVQKTHCDMAIGLGPSLRMLTGNRSFNQAVERAWFAWTQQIQLRRKLWCMAHARVQDGEAFGLLVTNPALPGVQLDLKVLETEQCQTPYLPSLEPGYIDGIKYDENDNILWYDILPFHPGSNWTFAYIEPRRVPPSQVLHWFRLVRPSAHRGIPDLTSTMNVGATNRRMREATVTSVETAASIAAIIESQMNPATSDEPDPVAPFQPFEIPRRSGLTMPMGWNARQMNAAHPNAQYGEFHRQQLSEMASPIGQPYNVAAHDSSTYSFASGKLDTLAYRAAIDIERADCNDLVLDRLFTAWFREWTLIENVEFTPNHQWDWPVHPVIDAVAEASATDTKLKNGTITLRQVFSDQGQDYEDQLSVMAEDWFGDATEENILKARQICLLRNCPQHAIQYVAQVVGISLPAQGQENQGNPDQGTSNEPDQAV